MKRVDPHKLGVLVIPLAVVVISVCAATASALYNHVSADINSDLEQCISEIKVNCKKSGYAENCEKAPIVERLKALYKQIYTSGSKPTDATKTECDAILAESKTMKSATVAEESKAKTSQTIPTAAGTDFDFMSNQSYSATSIISATSSGKCEQSKTGQIILVSNIKPDSGNLQAAFYNGNDWTKRGKIFEISSVVKDAIISKLKTDNKLQSVFGTTDEKIIKENLTGGAVFSEAPLNQTYSGSIYSSAWSGKAIPISSFSGPKTACESSFIAVNFQTAQKTLTDKYQVCVHSQDKTKDYKEKKTFLYPGEKTAATSYKTADKDRVISLGPCQQGSASETGQTTGVPASDNTTGAQAPGIGAAQIPSGQSASSCSDGACGGTSNGPTSDEISNTHNTTFPEGVKLALARLNQFRKEQGKTEFIADNKFQDFADFRAKYLSTYTFDGLNAAAGHPLITQHAQEKGIAMKEEVALNLSSDWTGMAQSLIDSYGKDGQEGHREGLINSSGKIGIVATTLKDGGYLLVVELSP